MAISINRYVDITSGVGASQQVQTRELIGRMFSNNQYIPTKTLLEFNSLLEVGNYFGTDSVEYGRAAMYFNWISKNITQAQKLGFYRWVTSNQPPQIWGTRITTTLSAFQAIDDGSITLTLAGDAQVLDGLDFTAAATLQDVAIVIQVAVRAAVANLQWTAATVTYRSDLGTFVFQGGNAASPATIDVGPGGVGTEIISLIGWGAGAILSDGALAETVTEVLTESKAASTNFGSYLFVPLTLTLNQVIESATWNDGQNVEFQYNTYVTPDNAEAWSAALIGFSGTVITLSPHYSEVAPLTTEYPEQIPMIVLAATDYDARNSTQNYMFQNNFINLTPSVTSDASATFYDNLQINYWGRTQESGQLIDFYQRGVMCGGANDPTDINTYANEQWLKARASADLMNLLLAVNEVPANQRGVGMVMSTLQSVIDTALFNGTISPGKPLTNQQKVYIGIITGDPLAYAQVSNIGYWVNAIVNPTNNQIDYIIVYSKDDVVRKIEGQHVLI